MLEILAVLGFSYEPAAPDRYGDASSARQEPTDFFELPAHGSLERTPDEALIAELLPCHSPEYC